MLERILASVIVKVLMRLASALRDAAASALKRLKQKKTADTLQQHTDAGAPREERRADEENHLNS